MTSCKVCLFYIRNISEAGLSNLVELEVVDLSSNLLQAVPTQQLHHQRHLLALNLSRNPLQTIGPHAFR
jgi:hypothetical protein